MPWKTERMRRRTEENSIVVLERDDTITPSRLLKLTYNLQVHAVAVHILRPEVRRKTARRLIRRKANKKYRHLVFIRRMKAFDTFLVKALEVTLTDSAKNHEDDEPVLSAALLAGAAVATTYIDKALVGDYILLGAVLHPAVCIAFFQARGGGMRSESKVRRNLAKRVTMLLMSVKRQPPWRGWGLGSSEAIVSANKLPPGKQLGTEAEFLESPIGAALLEWNSPLGVPLDVWAMASTATTECETCKLCCTFPAHAAHLHPTTGMCNDLVDKEAELD
ncbi:hypothetical protein B0H14DRAFT_2612893 [Mycena olivaceomarginata]|nr:hypothetical protein B0H14DRAFT_2612893 [Mycena olivaceomarginata]